MQTQQNRMQTLQPGRDQELICGVPQIVQVMASQLRSAVLPLSYLCLFTFDKV